MCVCVCGGVIIMVLDFQVISIILKRRIEFFFCVQSILKQQTKKHINKKNQDIIM